MCTRVTSRGRRSSVGATLDSLAPIAPREKDATSWTPSPPPLRVTPFFTYRNPGLVCQSLVMPMSSAIVCMQPHHRPTAARLAWALVSPSFPRRHFNRNSHPNMTKPDRTHAKQVSPGLPQSPRPERRRGGRRRPASGPERPPRPRDQSPSLARRPSRPPRLRLGPASAARKPRRLRLGARRRLGRPPPGRRNRRRRRRSERRW